MGMICLASRASGQSSLLIYNDNLVNGFQDWSWAVHDLNNTSPTHTGSKSISVFATNWQAASFYHSEFDTATYGDLDFWVHGGNAGGQRLQVYAETNNGPAAAYTLPGSLPANTWQHFTIPLTTLGVASRSNVNRFNIQLRSDGTTNVFYLDDIQITAKPAPALINVSIQTTQKLATADQRHFGVNIAQWDSHLKSPDNSTSSSLLKEMGCLVVRMPGGSLSDEYHWAAPPVNPWEASFGEMVRVSTNAGVQAFIVVNYGSGTPEEAAGWVRHSNITNNLGYKHWEIGNECYGLWERDTNAFDHDPYTYAIRASNYIAQMKAADPGIKIGVVSAPGENSFSNQFNYLHPAYNSRTGQTNYGWTPIMLATLKSMNVTPDFLVHHHYPEYTAGNNPAGSSDNDLTLLQSTGNWASDAASLRQMIADYFGTGGTNIELVVTENNADAGVQGRQSTSIVNGLYYADSLAQLLKTEFKGFVWWDFRNGTDTGGYFDSTIYGWRTYGDLGMVNGPSTRHPTFYAAKLMQWFARPGDKILAATSDYQWLSTYAARRANGSITLLVVNKSQITDLNSQITLNGFTPASTAIVRSYGILNDEAARTNGPATAKDISTNSVSIASASFTRSFPTYSMTLLTLSPSAPRLSAISPTAPGQFVFQLEGQPDVPYTIQSSTNLITWVSVATNTLVSPTLSVTNPITTNPPQKYWRAVWQP
ncbi:MAG: alpha-L-arabinofuranosidase [Verrucomicrobia bacterium]|nr:alpha-L-arabinofuranosidase [Verrucomicrobiota bacterium]